MIWTNLVIELKFAIECLKIKFEVGEAVTHLVWYKKVKYVKYS